MSAFQAAVAAFFGRSASRQSQVTGAATTATSSDPNGRGAPERVPVRFTLALLAALLTLAALLGVTSALADTAPTATIEAPTAVSYTTAHLQGAVNPNGGPSIAHWHFEFSKDPGGEGWSQAPDHELSQAESKESTPITVEEDLANGTLAPATTYFVRLVASNDGGEGDSSEEELTTKAVAKPTVTIESPSAVNPGNGLYYFAGHITPGGTDPAFETSWHFDCSPGCGTLSGAPIGADEAAHEVEAEAENLLANTKYVVTLHAKNQGGETEAQATFKTSAALPGLSTPSSVPNGQGEVGIGGFVNPRNSPLTGCRFDYGLTSSYGQSAPCEPAAEGIGSGHKPVPVRVQLSGLTAGATYHMQLIATNAVGVAHSEDATFRALSTPEEGGCANEARRIEQHATYLPDCRAYEMVSPPDKNGADVMGAAYRTRVALDGSAVAFASVTGFGDIHGTGAATDYMGIRSTVSEPGDNGWAVHGITPPQEPSTEATGFGSEPNYQGELSPDLSTGVFGAWSPLTDDPAVANVRNLYLRDDLRTPGPGHYQLISACPRCAETGKSLLENNPLPEIPIFNLLYELPKVSFIGGSPDFSHLYFESAQRLTADAPEQFFPFGHVNLYEYDHGTVRLAAVLPNGASPEDSQAGTGTNVRIEFIKHTSHPISSDGSRAVFTTHLNPPPEDKGDLYMRIDGRATIRLDASERSTPEEDQPSEYQDMATDGSRVFFTSPEALTDTAHPGGSSGPGQLYMWKRANSNETQQVSVDATGGAFTLSFEGATSAPLPFDASAGELQGALESLKGPAPLEEPLVRPGNVAVTGGPGAANPYLVTFTGDFAGANVSQLQADGSSLTGGAGTATISTTHPVHNLTLLSADGEPSDGNAPTGSAGTVYASEDGRYVYFAINGHDQLVAGGPTGNQDTSKLYLWHDGNLAYVGSLARDYNYKEGNSPFRGTSPDGRYFLFPSRSGEGLLSAHGGVDYDQVSPEENLNCHAGSGEPNPTCFEFYLYSADDNSLQCVSCDPSGAPPTTSADVSKKVGVAATQYGANHLSSPLTADGRHVFFNTAAPLLPGRDTNGVGDVYEFSPRSGTLHLISSGTSSQPAYFLEASPDGHDAFFIARQQLVGWDHDSSFDLYDARVGGGFPEPLASAAPCAGESCRPAAAPVTSPASPGSAGLESAGNPKPPHRPCPRGTHSVRAHGRARCARSKHHTSRKRARAGRGGTR